MHLFRFATIARRASKYANIHDAVRHGNVEEVAAMVKSGASINEIDEGKDRFTPLHWACHTGALEVRYNGFNMGLGLYLEIAFATIISVHMIKSC